MVEYLKETKVLVVQLAQRERVMDAKLAKVLDPERRVMLKAFMTQTDIFFLQSRA